MERESEGGLESWAVEEKEEESEGGLAVTLSLPSPLPQQERERRRLRPSSVRPSFGGGGLVTWAERMTTCLPACVARPPAAPAAAWLAEADDVTTDGWARRRNFSSLL